jgi:hypothetical protein
MSETQEVRDVLAQFYPQGFRPLRRSEPDDAPGKDTQTAQETNAAHAGYRAFAVAPGNVKPLRLDIRPARGLSIARPYNAISEIAYDREGFTGILLFWPNKLVTINGHNLRPVVEALLAGTCEWLAEFDDSGKWTPGAPIINKITTAGPKPAAKAEGAK